MALLNTVSLRNIAHLRQIDSQHLHHSVISWQWNGEDSVIVSALPQRLIEFEKNLFVVTSWKASCSQPPANHATSRLDAGLSCFFGLSMNPNLSSFAQPMP